MKSAKGLALACAFIVFPVIVYPIGTAALTVTYETGDTPRADHGYGKVAAELVLMLDRQHYRDAANPHELSDAELSARVFDRYLHDLDPDHLFFLQSDIDGFAQYRSTLGKQLREGNIDDAQILF